MRYQLPCDCGQIAEVEPCQAGQTVLCVCGKALTVPSMLQIKALKEVPVNQEQPKKKHRSFGMILRTFFAAILCLGVTVLFWQFDQGPSYTFFRGLTAAFFGTSMALMVRKLSRSPLAQDTALHRSFFVIGIVLLFPTFLLASYLWEYPPQPIDVSKKPVEFSFGSFQRPLYQDSTPILPSEHTILWMQDEIIDQMFPMQLSAYLKTLEQPTFSYNFQDNFEALKDTYRIWITTDAILFVLSIMSIVVHFFMPKQSVDVSGWSGSEWR